MTRERINEIADESENKMYFIGDGEEYDKAVIGVVDQGDDNRRFAYSLSALIQCIMEMDGCDYEDAVDYYWYNIYRSLPYLGVTGAPVIVDDTDACN